MSQGVWNQIENLQPAFQDKKSIVKSKKTSKIKKNFAVDLDLDVIAKKFIKRLSKIADFRRTIFKFLTALMKDDLSLKKNLFTPLAERVLLPL